ncbi:MAG: hypothetical protein ACI80V_000828 [Rhodothermales bacterium]|jgi:hypothetical protein
MNIRTSIALTLVVAAGLIGCDFQAAEDAFDEFAIIIQLEPINTVINGIVMDNSTGQLVSASLEFSGPGAGQLIDAYSDPISSLEASAGIVTFGLQNDVVPTEGSPFELTVTARAGGYFTSSETFNLIQTGDGQFTLRMSSSNIAASVVGTASAQDNSATAGAGGAVSQTVTVQTQQTQQTTATATVTVPQGAVPLTAAGTPLVGQINTQIRSYDSGRGLQSLPAAARQRSDGTNQAVGGAVFFKMSDSAGNVAVGATAASSGVTNSKSSGVCTGGILIGITSSDTTLRGTYDTVTGLGGTVDAEIYGYTPADGQNNLVASTVVEADGAGLRVDLCLGGAAGSTGVIDTSLFSGATPTADASEGIIYTFAFGSALVSTGPLAHQVSISGVAGAQSVEFTLVGSGINKTATAAVSNGTFPLSTLVGTSGDQAVVTNATYVLSARTPGSTQIVSESISNPLSGTTSLSIPSSSDLETYSVTASLQCDDPATQRFEVQITSESLDAVSAFYRIANAGDSWTLLPGGAITSKTATDSKIEIVGSLDLKPSTAYDFKGVLGNDGSDTTQTTPVAGGSWTILLSTSEVGIDCKNR